MKRLLSVFVFLCSFYSGFCQSTFKAGWNTYNTGYLIKEYVYNCTYGDSIRLVLADSAVTFCTSDSLITLVVNSPKGKSVIKTVTYLNAKKQVLRTEEYRDDFMQLLHEWKYDDKGRKIYHSSDNKVSSNSYKQHMDYAVDKKTGDIILSENSYCNGRIEFYTKSYFDKNNRKYKEVRLNDNNKDVIHIESYDYGENGRVKSRTVYFPEFKVTKKFDERDGIGMLKCYRIMPLGIPDRYTPQGRSQYIKKVLIKNKAVLLDPDCHDFEYKFYTKLVCEIIIKSTRINGGNQLIFRCAEAPKK